MANNLSSITSQNATQNGYDALQVQRGPNGLEPSKLPHNLLRLNNSLDDL